MSILSGIYFKMNILLRMNLLQIFRQFRRKSQMQVVLRTLISSMSQIPEIEKMLYLEAIMVLNEQELISLYDKISWVIAHWWAKDTLIFEIPNHA